MTDQTKDGGPAFPSHPEMVEVCEDGKLKPWGYGGMSLRDWFAGQALSNSTICTGSVDDWQLRAWFGDRGGVTRAEVVARQAHEYANAMLKERGQQ